ncbi:MAG TPA: sugar phosphate isomerase/epimerase family protein [Bryobacteraceae bacterium]|nr:sugar phosphate isomerase/epimerase family protein [Bryobacteraceae bacterium]
MSHIGPFRQAMCNEAFGATTLAETCRALRRIGYDGIEIAPFTLAESPSLITAAQRRDYRDMIRSEGLEFAGLHWLMVSPKGLHVTTPDDGLRARGWRHIDELIDLCADLGDNGVMVFGSPKQRETAGVQTPAEAVRRFTEGLVSVAAHAEKRGVTILVEALPHDQCDVINRLDEAVAVVDQVNSPAVRSMFDTHNAVDETEPHDALIARWFPYIRHVHVNEIDGRHPGTGNYDFGAILRALHQRQYAGWVSLEAFDFKPDAETIARESLAHLQAVMP